MTDPQVDELLADLDRALAIEPSPSVAARVRTSLAGDADARWPVLQWRRIAVGAAALLVVAVVVRPWSDEPPAPSPRPVAAAAVKPVAEPVAAAVAVPAAAPAPRVSEPPPVAARAEASREPEVIVSPSQRLALNQLAAAVRNGRITADSFPDPDEDEPRLLDVVQITPIVLDVVKISAGPGWRGRRCDSWIFQMKECSVTKTIAIKRVFGAVLTSALIFGSVGLAQTSEAPQAAPAPPAKPPAVEKPLVPLKIQVTIARYEGEKKTSSLPFTLWVNANDGGVTNLDVGIQVPVGSAASVQYRSVGTSINCRATTMDDGRFKVSLDLQDSSVASSKDNGATPTFQSISAHNLLLLRDGQNAQFIAATDKVSGEVTKVDVTLAVLK